MRNTATTGSRRIGWAFARHYLEMLAAMVVGMVTLGPLWPDVSNRVEPMALVMATDMSIGMAAWMAVRRQSVAAIVEMTLAMYLPFLVLFAPYWLGLLSSGSVLTLGHVLMLPAMAIVMLRRIDRHGGHAGHRHGAEHVVRTEPEEVTA